MSKDKTFWPYGILLSILAIIIACIVTIVYASRYPVYEDDFYLDSYQNIDYHFNEIQRKQTNFNKLFNLSFQNDKITILGKRKIKSYEVSSAELLHFKIEKLADLNPNILKTQILLTRPHQNTQDQVLQAKIEKDTLNIQLPNELESGRWQLKIKLIADDEATGFYNFELKIP
ncbi:hypothetical protein [Campylobacter cuniculorum]|uniref:hypothetical protein n=1 Tax=Campylobacter cuniculorum TaxID=374106 RepID=UPI0023EF7AA1|nr:hypothetical protein [Campylobacter cuniculorum]